jgi:hypothetical protein
MRERPPPPFHKWQTWQRQLFAYGVYVIWLAFAGLAGIGLAVISQLPACHDPPSSLFSSFCHTDSGIALCAIALVALLLLHLKYFLLICQIGYIRTSNFGVDEDD